VQIDILSGSSIQSLHTADTGLPDAQVFSTLGKELADKASSVYYTTSRKTGELRVAVVGVNDLKAAVREIKRHVKIAPTQ
jgi:hypothetical protein